MTKFPFTPAGVAAMCQHFYQFPDAELKVESEELGEDFPLWVTEHFELKPSQVAYLDKIAPQVIDFMAANAEFAFGNRRPIILAKEGEPDPEPESKLTKPKSKLAAVILPNGAFTAAGELVIEITY